MNGTGTGCGLLAAASVALAGCGGDNTASNVTPPGADTTATTEVLKAGAALLQEKQPLQSLNAYLDGFHFYSGDLGAQMEAHHYCALLNEDVIQCVIFDANTTGVVVVCSAGPALLRSTALYFARRRVRSSHTSAEG